MEAGGTCPDFEAVTQDGSRIRLSEYLSSGPVVLFFYPKALTLGCAMESCHFRDLRQEFAAVGATVLGISADEPDRQARFDDKYDLGFPLLSDPDRSVARDLGVKRPGPLMNRRTTFVIDVDARVLDVIHSEINMNSHADRALDVLRRRAGAGSRA